MTAWARGIGFLHPDLARKRWFTRFMSRGIWTWNETSIWQRENSLGKDEVARVVRLFHCCNSTDPAPTRWDKGHLNVDSMEFYIHGYI